MQWIGLKEEWPYCSTMHITLANTKHNRQYNMMPILALHQYRYEMFSFLHKCLYSNKIRPAVLCDYFYLNNSIH